ncbi:CRISPR-associated endoribonuclease Cas6 [Actinomadura craniellae]|uniref:CRISPR-associated endoribonuclease Cas6 n=1 Tax=Actinomadura craniellae TaxID=2231787 RepID=UPI001F26B66E|nr:CRISPR-associated endoribonuclease Cas6 [Actinomadura craniellae]
MRVDVGAEASHVPWPEVHGAARGVMYGLLGEQDAGLATELHDVGWQGHTLRPLGISPPVFQVAKRPKGVYPASGTGSLWLGSPVPRIAGCLLAALAGRQVIRWGSVHLKVRGMQLEPAPDHAKGEAVFDTVSPVVVRHESRYLLPGDAAYVERLTHNLRHKADVLGLPSAEIGVEVLGAGGRRRFEVNDAVRIGARARLRVSADPALLDALYDWGLGLNTNQGFGWVR